MNLRLKALTTYAEPEIRDQQDKLVAVLPAGSAADARRLAACWNACLGISTQNLERNLPVIELAERYNEVLRERDALAASLEVSPEFTDTARAALLWVLWHHQGGSSPVGQPIRYALGMGVHESLNKHQVQEAKRWAALTKSDSRDFHKGFDRPVPAAADSKPSSLGD